MDPNSPPPGQGAPGPGGGEDPTSLHDIAVDIVTDLQKLATGLAHAGADPNAVQQLTKMAQVISGVVKVLNQGPGVEQAAQHSAGGPPQPQTAPPGAPAPGQPHQPTIQAASQGLHQMMMQAAQQRMAQQQQPPGR